MNQTQTLAQRIIQIRRAHKLTQAHLAQRAATNTRTVVQIESGHGNPRLSTLENIARALDVTIAELFTQPKGTK